MPLETCSQSAITRRLPCSEGNFSAIGTNDLFIFSLALGDLLGGKMSWAKFSFLVNLLCY